MIHNSGRFVVDEFTCANAFDYPVYKPPSCRYIGCWIAGRFGDFVRWSVYRFDKTFEARSYCLKKGAPRFTTRRLALEYAASQSTAELVSDLEKDPKATQTTDQPPSRRGLSASRSGTRG